MKIAILAAMAASIVASIAQADNADTLPHLEKREQATQLVVDGRPYLVLGGELMNTATSDVAYMETVYPRLARMHLNTVLAAVAWDWVEPGEGKFDFHLVDAMLEGARKNNVRLIVLWFGSWKNSVSSFAPTWVKGDQKRFPRVRISSGKAVEILSPFADANRDADQKAYVALLHHLKEADPQHTVLMIQMQNEVGVLGDSRDRSDAAEEAFKQQVPRELLNQLNRERPPLDPELSKRMQSVGSKTSGTWTEVFGDGAATDEIFMAWHYARYMEALTKAGKVELALPVFTNTWIVQPEDKGPGDYPSGGPEPLVIDVWKAGAPSIDMNAPDIYLPDFAGWCERFHRQNNPLFIPESRGDAIGAANAFYAIGRHAAIGYSPFGIDVTGRLLALRPDPMSTTQPTAPDVEALPLPKAYAVLGQLAPMILQHQSAGTISAVSLNQERRSEKIEMGGYILDVAVRRNRRDPSQMSQVGYALIMPGEKDQFVIAGCDVQVTFTPAGEGQEIAGLGRAEAGSVVDGQWKTHRILSGDDVLLDYKLATAAEARQSGSGLRFDGGPTIQRVTLYRYR